MKEALKRALGKKTLHLPPGSQGKSQTVLPSDGSAPAKKEHISPVPDAEASVTLERTPRARQQGSAAAAIRISREERKQREAARRQQAALQQLARAYGATPATSQPVKQDPWTLTVDSDTKPHPFLLERPRPYDLISLSHSGISERLSTSKNAADVRELVLGLDFGTSTVKVIVGDRSAGLAFAVPFSDAEGAERYLLPSRLWEGDHAFSLRGGGGVHRNLKLSLLTSHVREDDIQRAVAFLALVIRHTRAWLFCDQTEIYRHARIVWKLTVGIPVERYKPVHGAPDIAQRFRLVARSAWLAAGGREERIGMESVEAAIRRARELENGRSAETESEDVEVATIPELSAQIYGFLRSDQFDRHARNIYMVVDIGAGTVDSSLFYVRRVRRGKWDFEFYTAQVQQNGVVNLHRARVQWWLQALESRRPSLPEIVSVFRNNELPSDYHGAIPEQLQDYLRGSRLTFLDTQSDPDNEFYRKRVVAQVRGATLYRARDYIDHNLLAGIPMFVCGGGARMSYYRRLEGELRDFPGVSWLHAEARPLVVPSTLQAPHLRHEDFDRLSVAFGLSFLEVGSVVRAIPQPRVPLPAQRERADRDDLYPK